jgi:hypothetical protein
MVPLKSSKKAVLLIPKTNPKITPPHNRERDV